jgi:hypothetical protein
MATSTSAGKITYAKTVQERAPSTELHLFSDGDESLLVKRY